MLDTDEQEPIARKDYNQRKVKKSKRIKKAKKKKSSSKFVKKVPTFFGLDNSTEDAESEEEIESAYTELARALFVQKLEGKPTSQTIYNQMTNDFKLRSAIEK